MIEQFGGSDSIATVESEGLPCHTLTALRARAKLSEAGMAPELQEVTQDAHPSSKDLSGEETLNNNVSNGDISTRSRK